MDDNKRVVLIAAPPSMGKTHSLYKLADDPGVAYLNTDLKDLPFRIPKNGMKTLKIDEPTLIFDALDDLEENHPEVHTVVLDTITFLMDMYEMQVVQTAVDTRKAWGGYAKFYKDILHRVKTSEKNFIILAHSFTEYNEEQLSQDTKVPVKGAVGKVGVEADFNIVLSCKKVTLKQLTKEGCKSDFLNITAKEERLGFKFVFQTELTKETLSEKIRSPMGLWNDSELYIDNDIAHITKRLSEYYS